MRCYLKVPMNYDVYLEYSILLNVIYMAMSIIMNLVNHVYELIIDYAILKLVD